MQLGIRDNDPMVIHGEPVTVAVLDSGISAHPDLSGALRAFQDFTANARREPYDDYGHGTHVCGILCGSGALQHGKYQGICPGAGLVVGKVLDRRGDGSVEEMLAGMEWILRLRKQYDLKLLNVSVGISKLLQSWKETRLRKALERLSDSGILVICAAGNKGPMPGTLSMLGESREVISVGCHDGAYFAWDPDRCENCSGRGNQSRFPRKPDVVAPGTRIHSCSSTYRAGMPLEYGYESRSGTSMATPIVTGCLARLLRIRPELSAGELRRILTASAKDLGEPWNKQGWGMVSPADMQRAALHHETFRYF